MIAKVIAEIGINHEGSDLIAQKLIEAAAQTGCDAIKFQYRNLNRTHMFSKGAGREIGDEVLIEEIGKNYLEPSSIEKLAHYAKTLSLKIGISFFTVEDFHDFNADQHQLFDFYKVPSAELMNLQLVHELLRTEKFVYISTGMHHEAEIESALEKIRQLDNWAPMHCISNYPVSQHNSQMGYIKYLENRWQRPCGFSSHDANWELCLVGLTLGASTIERHITLDKNANGLDHSTSSVPEEFQKIVNYSRNINVILSGNSPRHPNQGELLNRQNLGRSFYAKHELPPGTQIRAEDFSYRSPATGIGVDEFNRSIGMKTLRKVNAGSSLTKSHLLSMNTELSSDQIMKAKALNLSLPVRVSDYEYISHQIPLGCFEFHLSYQEVEAGLTLEVNHKHRFSVHLPDYVSSNELIDPFSSDDAIRRKSLLCIQRTFDFAERLGRETGHIVPVVASLSSRTLGRSKFYLEIQKLFNGFKGSWSFLTLQWLPPTAWYFGGSVQLEQVNREIDIYEILEKNIYLTMDTSHLILGRNAFGFDAPNLIRKLSSQIKHVHISDASGIDGEGLQFDLLGNQNSEIFRLVSRLGTLQVIEVWQGHLNDNFGFKHSVQLLTSGIHGV